MRDCPFSIFLRTFEKGFFRLARLVLVTFGKDWCEMRGITNLSSRYAIYTRALQK